MAGIWPNKGDTALGYGDVMPGKNLSAVYIHPLAIAYDQVSSCAPYSCVDQAGGAFGPGFYSCPLHVPRWHDAGH